MDSTKIGKFRVYYDNREEFHRLRREVFGNHEYYAEFETDKPYIIDAGAHIGLSVLYFKSLAPGAEILAIEPNSKVLPLLQKNVFENQLEGVVIEPVALSDRAGREKFYLDASAWQWYSTAGMHKGAWNGRQESLELTVETRRLADFLVQRVDLLKMDIEGVEEKVLVDCGDEIRRVRELMVEFHGVGNNSLVRLVRFLEEEGFGVEVIKGTRRVDPAKATGLSMVRAMRAA